jgi:tetratricopeptide (TPR) repeat protein
MRTPTLCLNMIVKNESKIITRLFDSVLPIIDCYCICDTGSTDNTIQIINDYFSEKGITGKIVTEPFKNFCYNRNFALNKCIGMSDYVLLMDADMILQIKNFDKNELLNAQTFCLFQGNDSFYYQNMRIIENNGLYSYCGVTHEYINCPKEATIAIIKKENLFIADYGDGGCKSDKFERDIRLLLDGIKEEPNNPRYYFYLANSYHDSGRFGEAIDVYKKRIELGNWKEEVWYSYYRIGLCFKNIGKMDKAIKSWMDGYNLYPERLEGIYEIIKYYRLISKHNLANFFYQEADRILKLKLNRENYLFLHNDIYTHQIYYEYSIFSSYVGNYNINDEIIQILNNSNNAPENNNLLQNMKFYKSILKCKEKVILDDKVKINLNGTEYDFKSSSSCLVKNNNNGYKLNIRYVNYTIKPDGTYIDCDKHIITLNKYIELDNKLNVILEKWMETSFEDRIYIGVEDIRIWKNNNDDNNNDDNNTLNFIGTGFHKNNKIGIVSGLYNTNTTKIEFNELTASFNNESLCEKNWVFVDYDNKDCVIYKWYPLQICKINNEDKTLDMIKCINMPKIFSYMRGSTCGFNYYIKTNLNDNNDNNINLIIKEKEIWFITHIVSYEQPRHYYHMIVVFDEQLNLLRYSAPFKFEGEPIEYCLSIIVDDERVLINYSTWDRTTRIGVYDKKYIDSILKYN